MIFGVILIFLIGCTCCIICKKKSRNHNQTLNARFTAAEANTNNNNNSQVTFNRGVSVISYESALRNSTIIVQPINQVDINNLNESKLPTYEEFTSKQNEHF